MNITDIEVGQTYACKFKIRTFVNKDGKAIDTRQLQPGQPVSGGEPGEYEGFGFIIKRDVDKQLLKVLDKELEREWIIGWDSVWDVDVVKWVGN